MTDRSPDRSPAAYLVNLVQMIVDRMDSAAARVLLGVQLQGDTVRRQDTITRRLVVLMVGHALILAGWALVSWWRSGTGSCS